MHRKDDANYTHLQAIMNSNSQKDNRLHTHFVVARSVRPTPPHPRTKGRTSMQQQCQAMHNPSFLQLSLMNAALVYLDKTRPQV
jgi:hypothetical protein